jgi:hypothetical protein
VCAKGAAGKGEAATHWTPQGVRVYTFFVYLSDVEVRAGEDAAARGGGYGAGVKGAYGKGEAAAHWTPQGVRVYTFFVYLSDVEVCRGGGRRGFRGKWMLCV